MPPIRITIVPKNDEKELIEPDQMSIFQVKPFLANFLNLYLLLTSENVWKRKKTPWRSDISNEVAGFSLQLC